jgi:uncharacterized phage-associated protein
MGEVGQGEVRVDVPVRNEEKFRNVLLYILKKIGGKPNVGKTVLFKLLYFIDFDFYEIYEEQLMGLTYLKRLHGPVPREFDGFIEKMIRNDELDEFVSSYYDHRQVRFMAKRDPDLNCLSGRELGHVEAVLGRYADWSATSLSELSHRDTPWMAAKDGEPIAYESVFYRGPETSVRSYAEDVEKAP